MIGIIVSIFIAVWFFKSAKKQQKSGFGWALLGFISYHATTLLTSAVVFLLLSSIEMRIDSDGAAIMLGLFIGAILIAAGIAVTSLIYSHFLKPGLPCEIEEDQVSLPRPTLDVSSKIWKCSCGEINLKMADKCRICDRPRPEIQVVGASAV